MTTTPNGDPLTIEGFGEEWRRFDQSALSASERRTIFDAYFSVFPWVDLPDQAEGFDLGCGSGRWAQLVAPRVGMLHCIDPSDAIDVARLNLSTLSNTRFHRASVDAIPLPDASMDFGYSLGVLHHVPDPNAGLRACVSKLKLGAPFLLYLYYAFDNRPLWFRLIWRISDWMRRVISSLPSRLRQWVSDVLALFAYWPLARLALAAERAGADVRHFPLSTYRNYSFYTMRTDALDRFGTRLERRFSRRELLAMMERAGLYRITVSPSEPFWCAVGYRRV
jgi:SAM-dependent methyltransferase